MGKLKAYSLQLEMFEECPILAKYKEGDNFNRRNTLEYFEDSAKG